MTRSLLRLADRLRELGLKSQLTTGQERVESGLLQGGPDGVADGRALLDDVEAGDARTARQHNNANVLSIGARVIPEEEIPNVVSAWFDAKFEGGRHERRVEKITELEKEK